MAPDAVVAVEPPEGGQSGLVFVGEGTPALQRFA